MPSNWEVCRLEHPRYKRAVLAGGNHYRGTRKAMQALAGMQPTRNTRQDKASKQPYSLLLGHIPVFSCFSRCRECLLNYGPNYGIRTHDRICKRLTYKHKTSESQAQHNNGITGNNSCYCEKFI